jgi:hypothetical protein
MIQARTVFRSFLGRVVAWFMKSKIKKKPLREGLFHFKRKN